MTQGRIFVLVATLAMCCSMTTVASSQETPANSGGAAIAADSSSDLAPTSSIPWNPPRAIPAHEPWVDVLNAPLTLVSLPIRALAAATEAGLLHVQQGGIVPRTQVWFAVLPSVGLRVGPASLGDRSGFGAAVEYAPPRLRGLVRAGLAGSTAQYSHGGVELGARWLFARYAYDWRPQEAYYGIGPDARSNDASNYAAQSERAELQLQLRRGTRLRSELGAWVGERQSVLRRGREDGRPSFETPFPQDATGWLDVHQQHFVTGARAALDTRAGHPHWSHGAQLAVQAERFGPRTPGGHELFGGSDASPGFTRVSLEGRTGWSFMRDPRTIRVAARVVDVAPFDRTRPPALFDLSTLGGGAGLAGFEPGRFHGLDLVVAELGYLFPVGQYAELEVSTELGSISDDVWRATRMDRLEQSYGVMLRPRTEKAPLGALGVHWSREGVRFGLSLGGVE